MNIENLTTEELKTLHTLIGKALEEPKTQKVCSDPVDRMVEDMLDGFDFSKVQRTMLALNWKWTFAEHLIPTEDELKVEAERLLRQAAKGRLDEFEEYHWEVPITASTDGFEARAYCDESKTQISGLELVFVVSEWGFHFG
jgi:hypothetical protein